MTGKSRVWFITGTSRGLGRIWAEAALARGDRVAATARDIGALDDLVSLHGDQILPLALDVTDMQAVKHAVAATIDRFGCLDIAVNNAGYGQFGTIEELTETEVRDQMETNFFGAFWVTQAVLPQMRAQGAGHIIQVSSIGGVNATATTGAYHASKWALEGFSQALAAEVAAFGIKVTLVEPAGYATDWAGVSARRAQPMPIYEPVRQARVELRRKLVPGDPPATAAAILEVVDAVDPPLRILLGAGTVDTMRAEYARRMETWERWRAVSEAAQGAASPGPGR